MHIVSYSVVVNYDYEMTALRAFHLPEGTRVITTPSGLLVRVEGDGGRSSGSGGGGAPFPTGL